MNPGVARRETLARAAEQFGTPAYVYFLDEILERIDLLQRAFGGRFVVSYAIKSNPNIALLRHLREKVATLDASSAGEVDRGIAAGYEAGKISLSGPAKRPFELQRAVDLGCGEIICESERDLEALDRLGSETGRRVPVLIRINPARMPRKFGVNMAGRPSQFGIDEEDVGPVVEKLPQWRNLDLQGFHIYSGTNCLSEDAIAENFGIFIDLFARFSEQYGCAPRKLIFGSGFGIPYHVGEEPLDVRKLAELINPQVDQMLGRPLLADARCVLEMGRFLVGPAGYFLTSVVGEKRSRGVDIRLCDGGFNDHLAACGMLGMVIRRNYPMWKVTGGDDGESREYMLVGPLCTTIDVLGQKVPLPELARGDVIAVGSSGAYGLTSSPTRFISHPEPRELLVVGDDILDITES